MPTKTIYSQDEIVLYHATFNQLFNRIMRDGLKAGSYFADDPQVAIDHFWKKYEVALGKRRWHVPREVTKRRLKGINPKNPMTIVLLEVRIPDERYLERRGKYYYYTRRIPLENIRLMGNFGKAVARKRPKLIYSAAPRQVNISRNTVNCPLWGSQISLEQCELCEFHEGYDDDGLVACMFDGENNDRIKRLNLKSSGSKRRIYSRLIPRTSADVMKRICYHVTTQKDKVLREGLKTREQLMEGEGYGLGGGSGEYVSLTDDLQTARDIYDNLIWANRYYSGRVSWRELLEMARRGEMASRPYNDVLEEVVKGKELDDPTSRDGKDFFNQWLIARERAGGPEDTVIIFSDVNKLASIPEDQIAILEVEVSPSFIPNTEFSGALIDAFDHLEYYYGISKEDFFKNDLMNYPSRVIPLMQRKYLEKYYQPGVSKEKLLQEAQDKAEEAAYWVEQTRKALMNIPLNELQVRPEDVRVRKVISSRRTVYSASPYIRPLRDWPKDQYEARKLGLQKFSDWFDIHYLVTIPQMKYLIDRYGGRERILEVLGELSLKFVCAKSKDYYMAYDGANNILLINVFYVTYKSEKEIEEMLVHEITHYFQIIEDAFFPKKYRGVMEYLHLPYEEEAYMTMIYGMLARGMSEDEIIDHFMGFFGRGGDVIREIRLRAWVKKIIEMAYENMEKNAGAIRRIYAKEPIFYHVTTAKSKVLREGLKPRKELKEVTGLGGGPSDTISFTSSFEVARAIYHGLLFARKVSRGEISPQQLVERMKTGEDAQRPYYDDFLNLVDNYYGSHKRFLEILLNRKKVEPVSELPGAIFLAREDQLPEGTEPVLESKVDEEYPDGKPRYSLYRRPCTEEEYKHVLNIMIKMYLSAREKAGGMRDPYFFAADFDYLAKVPEEEIAILAFKISTEKLESSDPRITEKIKEFHERYGITLQQMIEHDFDPDRLRGLATRGDPNNAYFDVDIQNLKKMYDFSERVEGEYRLPSGQYAELLGEVNPQTGEMIRLARRIYPGNISLKFFSGRSIERRTKEAESGRGNPEGKLIYSVENNVENLIRRYYYWMRRRGETPNVTSWKSFCREKGYPRKIYDQGLDELRRRKKMEFLENPNYYPSNPDYEYSPFNQPDYEARLANPFKDYMEELVRSYEDYLELRERDDTPWEWRNFCRRNNTGEKIYLEGLEYLGFNDGPPWGRISSRLKRIYRSLRRKKESGVLDLPHLNLDPNLWEDSLLKKEVEEEILSRLYSWLEEEGVGKDWIERIYIIGSSAGYQYRDTSDVDVTIVPDAEALKKKAEEIYGEDGLRTLIKRMISDLNGYYIHRHDVNYYIRTERGLPIGEAIYDVFDRKWVKPPQRIPEDFDPEREYRSEIMQSESRISVIDTVIGKLYRRVRDCIILSEYDRPDIPDKIGRKLEVINQLCEWLRNEYLDIWRARRKAYKTQGKQDTKENILYKYLERYGYLDLLHRIYDIYGRGIDSLEDIWEIKEALKTPE